MYASGLDTALSIAAVKVKNLAYVGLDASVMETHIAYPTDSHLGLKVLQKMLNKARQSA